MNQLLIWDFPIRFFHWSLVFLMVGLFYTGFTGEMVWHFRLAYVVLTLIFFRIFLGFFGSTYARFNSFLFNPLEIFTYFKNLFNPQTEKHYLGHNPLGGLSVIVLLSLILVQGISGLFTTDDIASEGALYSLVSSKTASFFTTFHKTNFNLIIAMVLIHISAIYFYLFYKKENLIKPMITGYKMTKETPILKPVKMWVALIFLLISTLLVVIIVNLPILLKLFK